MVKKLINVISYFVESEDVYRKNRWVKVIESLTNDDNKNFKKLTAEMKLS